MKIFLSSITESNCPLNLGKVAYYRCTNTAIWWARLDSNQDDGIMSRAF